MHTKRNFINLILALAFSVSLCMNLKCEAGPFHRHGVSKEGVQVGGFDFQLRRSQPYNLLPNTTDCNAKLVEYQPSTLETSWKTGIASLKSNDAAWGSGCSKIRQELESHKKIVHDIDRHALATNPTSFSSLSHHVYRDNCTGLEKLVPIEPLTSFLRHPLAICIPGEADLIFDKSFLLIPFAEEIGAKQSYKWLFDAGASTYDTGLGGASQSWFVNTYRSRGYEFDRIIGWEAAPTEPERQWSTVPADVKRKTSWYNIPATTEVGGADNPLTFIKELTRPEDYVVFKLDIDAPDVEVSLVKQILSDPELWALIDDFFFEHHVAGSPMQFRGWGDLSKATTTLGDIEDSYDIFTFLREKGIRAHSWV